ncbi:MAG: protease modulator HflC [Desulfomonilaceae bacterium]|nr:protease modulator HflC [Desulfomonilaceae bacterium]
MIKIIIALAVIGIVASQTAFIIYPPEQGLILQFGKPIRTITEPDLYFKYPMIQDLLVFDKRILVADARPAEYITLDKKRLTVDTVTRWKIVKPLEFYQSVNNYQGATARLQDIIFGRLRQEIANHNFKAFIREKRENIMEQVTLETRQQARRFGIDVIDVRIKRVDLPEEVQNSVFARMRAERERIAKRYRAEGEEQGREIRANADKEREIILARAYETAQLLRGEGDAEATSVYADAYGKNKEFYSFLRHLDVYKKVFAEDTTLLLRPDSPLLRFIDSPGFPVNNRAGGERLPRRPMGTGATEVKPDVESR